MQLIVLGMHRSGTSMLARVLNLMGAYFGPEGIGTSANPENPKGFWERRDVRAINDSTLHAVGCDWDRVSAFDVNALPGSVAEEFRARASRLVLELDANRPWFLKEPRLCLMLPLWRKFLEIPVCIHIHRNPVEVAASLHTRNQMPMQVGLALWEAYIASALSASADLPSITVSHHRLTTNPVPEVERLYAGLIEQGVSGLRMPSGRELAAFIDPALYRERSTRKNLRGFSQAAQLEIFRALEAGLAQARNVVAGLGRESRECLARYEAELPPLQIKRAAPEPTEAVLKEKVVARDQENKLLRESVAKHEEILRSRDMQHTQDSIALGQLQAMITHGEREIAAARKRIEELAAEMRVRDERLADQATEMEELRDRSIRLETRILGYKDEIGRLTEELRQRDRHIARLEAEAVTGRNDMKRLTAELAAVGSQAREACHALDQERENVQVLRDKLASRDLLLEERGMELAQQMSSLHQAEAELRKAEAGTEDRFREIVAISRLLLEQEETLRDSVKQREASEAALAASKRELETIRNSRAWRLLTRLRVLGGMFGRRSRGGELEMKAAAASIEKCGLFDRAWYLRTYDDVARSGMDPLEHYLRFGALEGRNPGIGFDTNEYLKRNPDVREAGINPLLHYAAHGKAEGRLPK